LDHICFRGIASQRMFRMLNMTYISWSRDSDNFFINVKFLCLAMLLAVFLRNVKC